MNDGKNGAWSNLKGFTITLKYAQVDSASLPEDENGYLSCTDNDFNNTEIFEEAVPLSPGINSVTHLAESSSGSIMGPKLFGGQVFGVGSFASLASGCVPPWCSLLEITQDGPGGFWTLEELELYGDGTVSMTNGSATILVDRAAIRLYQVGRGVTRAGRSGAQIHAIPAGEAHFVFSGVGGAAIYDVRWGTNVSAITAREDGGGWILDSFVVEHRDSDGESWIITVPQTTWE
ncbi:hypothetical protein [Enhygromyxa salina]|uniref:hypothetical protein n=1 Tax=Enhygromyxa salina TaxID=215803 RepID=UPI0015E5C494|nr:hypothetical protein [Enhygromyxa salina]